MRRAICDAARGSVRNRRGAAGIRLASTVSSRIRWRCVIANLAFAARSARRRALVLGVVARDGGRLLARGVVAGVAGAAFIAWLMRGLLYDVSPWDLRTYAAIPVLVAAGVIACVLPARLRSP